MDKTYETPEVKELGSLEELTLPDQPKFVAETDGFSYRESTSGGSADQLNQPGSC